MRDSTLMFRNYKHAVLSRKGKRFCLMGSVHVDQGLGWDRIPWFLSVVCTAGMWCGCFTRILENWPVWAVIILSALPIISVFASR